MKQRIAKILSVAGLTCAIPSVFGWDVYEQAKNGNVTRLQGTIPAYCPGGVYSDADNLRGALLVVEDYLNAFRANYEKLAVPEWNPKNVIYKYCHDENNMAEILEEVFKLDEMVKQSLKKRDLYDEEDEENPMDKTSFIWEQDMQFSKKKNCKYLLMRYGCALRLPAIVNECKKEHGKYVFEDLPRREFDRIVHDIKEYLENLVLDESRLQYNTSREFVTNYHSKDNLKSRIKDALKLREVARQGLGIKN